MSALAIAAAVEFVPAWYGSVNPQVTAVQVLTPSLYRPDPGCSAQPDLAVCLQHWRFMHDYCSISPDELPLLGSAVDFRGPCARHDRCLEDGGANDTCNRLLFAEMRQNCMARYDRWDPRRPICSRVAEAYLDAVGPLLSVIRP
ncbi:hypothetical protein [Nocardia inohanensis]|uniref:hypothetical protein n=1 Tax=Nocardia inohanensis TaxID=209246 RepID=UPI0012FB1549|nr:hypothetical protein [Nocardia inohanensis]